MDEKKSTVGSDGLKKNLGVGTAISVVVGCVIGSGVFFKPQAIYTATGGAPGLGILAWFFTGVISICAALTFAEVAVLIPKTGGIVTYLREIYSPRMGFVSGWVQIILFYPAMVSALAVAFANQAAIFVGKGYTVPIAIACIFVLILLNCLGSKVAGSIQIIFTICKLIPIFMLMIFGFIRGGGTNPIMSPMIGHDLNPITVFGQLLVAVLFAFEGWTGVGAIAGEMKKPSKDLPVAIVGGVSIIMAIYMIVNVAYLYVIPANELATLDAPASAVAIKIFGEMGGKIISVGIMISVFGACNGFILSGSRIAYSLAEEKLFPFATTFKKLNKAQAPVNSIILVGTIGCLYSVTGQFNLLTDLGILSCWTFYTLSFWGVIKLRKEKPELERSYKVPLYPVVPIIASLSGIFVIVNQVFLSGIHTTVISLGSIGIMLLGVPIYAYLTKK